MTTIWMFAPEGAEFVHLVLVGTAEESLLTPDEFFDRIEAIESSRVADRLPTFS